MNKISETYRLIATLSLKLEKHTKEAGLSQVRSWGHLPKAVNAGPAQKKLEPCIQMQSHPENLPKALGARERGWLLPPSFPQEPGL